MVANWIAMLLALVTCGTAHAADRVVTLTRPPPLAQYLAAAPQIASPRDAAERRINTALGRLDDAGRKAAAGCRRKGQAWQRAVRVTMHGPGYLSYEVADAYDCGGVHPDDDIYTVAYDLRTGRPVDWTMLLPSTLTGTVSLKLGADGTRTVSLDSPALRQRFLAAQPLQADPADSTQCARALAFALPSGLRAWLDGPAGALAVQPNMPHGADACVQPLVLPAAELRQLGAALPWWMRWLRRGCASDGNGRTRRNRDLAPRPSSTGPVGMKAARLIPLAILLLAVAAAGGWIAFRRDAGPDATAGQAWLDEFATLLTSPGLLGAHGPAALAYFPRLGTWPGSGCQTTWRKSDGLGPVIVSQSLELARQEADPCDQAQFGQLSTVLRQSEGVTPGALVDRLTAQFGVPELHRDTGLSGSITYGWDVLYGVHIRLEEPVRPGGATTFLVVLTRFLGASAALPSPADGERWLDRAVALLTGPDLPAAHGMQAVRLVDAAMRPEPALDGGCGTSFSTGGATVKEPIAYDKWLTLQAAESDCDNAGFEYLSLTVWQRPPVTVQAMVERLSGTLGPPALNRDFARQVLHYEWKTGRGTMVGVSEFIGSASRVFTARLWKE